MTLAQTFLNFLIIPIINVIVFVVFIRVILGWLIAFNVVNTSNQLVHTIWRMSSAMTEPLFTPLRRVLPNLGGVDLSPLVVLIGLYFLTALLRTQLCPALGPYQFCY